MSMRPAAASSAEPMPSWTRARLQRDTTPAPSQAPATAAAIMDARVGMATVTIAM